MDIRIGNTSKLFLFNNKISLIIRPSAISMTISSIIILGCVFYLGILLFASDYIKDKSLFIFFISALYPLYSFSYKEISEIDLKQRSLIQKKYILWFCFDFYETSWQENSYFSYDIVYDSYQNISSIWLVLRYNDQQGSRKLIKFIETNSFFEFKKIFNKKFPTHVIMEWHE